MTTPAPVDRARPSVDVVIAVHDAERPVQRAVESVLESGLSIGGELRVTVVCHNLPATEVAATLTGAAATSVRLLELGDGIRSPAGPFNHGIANSTATFVSIMGSDDYLEPGALRSWLTLAETGSYGAVIAPQRHASGAPVRTPPVRPARTGPLDPVKDRLAYRTAPLGLLRLETITRLGLELTPGLSTGEDQLFSAMLWFSGERLAYARRSPRYVVGDDARTRVTGVSRTLEEEFRAIDGLIASDRFGALGEASRRAIGARIARINVFGAASARTTDESWTRDDAMAMARFLTKLDAAAPGFAKPLAIADRRLLDALADPSTDAASIRALVAARRRFGHPRTLLPRELRSVLAIESPLRFMAASALI